MNYSDLREAISKEAFIHAKSGTNIVGNEHTGARDPWIFDFRAILLQPKWLNRYAEIFWELHAHLLPFQVGGMETAGIPLVAAIVMKGVERGTPVNGFYVRKSRKRQGLMKYIEGSLTKEPVVIVDDLMNSGQSLSKEIDILAAAGLDVQSAFVLLTFRNDNAYQFLQEKKISLTKLFDLKDFGMPLVRSGEKEPPGSFEQVWRYAAPNPSFNLVVQKSTPAIGERLLYIGCDDGTFRALDKMNGSIVWEFKTGKHPPGKGILSSPAVHDLTVFFGAYDGNVYALDAETGTLRWTYDNADWVGSSPALSAKLGHLYIGLEFGLWRKQGGIAALDIKTGKHIWSARHSSLTHASPLYIESESLVVIGSNDGNLYAYDAATGTERWRYATRADIKMSSAYDAKRGWVICASMDGSVYAVSVKDGVPVHVHETNAGIYGTPYVYDDSVFVASLDKCVYALDLEKWSERWVFETSGRIFSSPIVSGDSLFIGSNDGRMYEIDIKSGSIRGLFQTNERIVSPVRVDGERFYVRTVADEIFCLNRATPRT